MNRRFFLKTVGGSAAAIGLGAAVGVGLVHVATPQAVASKKKNIVLYIVDDQGTGDAGCYGHPRIQTPALDQLAKEGIVFTNAFCTSASCSASRSVILSGRHNHATGQYGHSHDIHNFKTFETTPTLPAILGKHGYHTIHAGKFHVQPESAYPFDKFIEWLGPVEMADLCRQAFEDAGDRPFFLCFCTAEPHRPFTHDNCDKVSPDAVEVPAYLPDIPECRQELAEYYASIRRADKGLARLVELLKQTGCYDDTLILYLSDNGAAFPGAKTTLYDPGIRLPFVVRHPSLRHPGSVSDAMISYTDIAPTLLGYAGIDPTDQLFHGPSFLSESPPVEPVGRQAVYLSHTFHEVTMYYPMRGIRTRQFKFIWNLAFKLDYPFASDLYESKTWQAVLKNNAAVFGKRSIEAYLHRPQFELYDIVKDPDEICNLADNPAYRPDMEAFKRQLKEFQTRTQDPWIVKWSYA